MSETQTTETTVEEPVVESPTAAADALGYDEDGEDAVEPSVPAAPEGGGEAPVVAPVVAEAEPVAVVEPTEPAAPEPAGVDGEEPTVEATPVVALDPIAQAAQAAKAALDAQTAADAQKAPVETQPQPFDRAAAREQIVKTYTEKYAISPETAERLATEPEKVLPELLGGMVVDVYEAVYHTFVQMAEKTLPEMIRQHSAGRDQENRFFDSHPQLADHVRANPTTLNQVAEAATFWRKQNPVASSEEAVAGIGTLLYALFGITKEAAAASNGAAAPASTVAPSSTPKLPRKPAGAGSGQAPIVPGINPMEEALSFELPDYDE